MYEAVTHSCMVMISREYKGRDGFLSRPSDYQPLNNKDLGLAKCRSLAHLCPACALFGALDGRNLTWKGRVNIGDAVLVEDEPKFLMGKAMPQQETPRPKPRPGSKQFTDYYPDGRMAGRKFYQRSQGYGTTQTPDRRNRRAQLAEPLKPGFHFKASLHYTNLKFEELGALLRVILLPEGVLHGVGACKNSGWGAVQIGIERWQKHDPASRYRGGPRSLALVGESLKQASDELIQLSVEQGLLHAGALQRLEELSKPVGLGGLS